MPPTARRTFLSNFVVSTLAAGLTLIVVAGAAFSSDEIEVQFLEAADRLDRRAEGLAFFDLPLRVRARFEVTLMNDLYASDALARPYATTAGPGFENDESLESQFALTRALSDTVEIGVVWGARSPVGPIDLFDFERQTVGAMIRIVP